MAGIIPSEENSIFALDIGTRSVIGIVSLVDAGTLRVAAQYVVEHQSRSMFDGQIHDIPKVADTVMEVKRSLEKKVGFSLTKAAIAAAGRSLVTKQCHVEMEVGEGTEIDLASVNSLEIEAIRKAHSEISPLGSGISERYYCVGYSVVRYYLDNYPIGNLVGHTGSTAGADVLATFLPESVVNGLYSVLRRVGLEPVNLTLEPIAALEVVIPESVRLLNLALVDIGAGTSDIAITRKGTVISYGMVPVAGDEITESIAEALLVSFNEAEKIKRSLEKGGSLVYKDILGKEKTIDCAEAAGLIDPVLDKLAAEVAQTIISLNGGDPPRTAFCIGGGSRLPGLTDKLAEKLGIEPGKVAVMGREAIENLAVDEEGLEGPEGVTVVGIAAVAIKKIGQSFIKIKVDGKEFSLFNSRELTVSNALSMVDFNPRNLIGQNGKDLKFLLNGTPQVVYGGLVKPAEVYVNGQKKNLKTPIREGDEITVLKAVDGDDARAFVQDFVERAGRKRVIINGRQREIGPACFLNGEKAPLDSEIKSGGQLEMKWTIEELFKNVFSNGCTVLVNDKPAAPGYELQDGDDLKLLRDGPSSENLVVSIEDSSVELLSPWATINVTVNGDQIKLEGKKRYIFIDVFNHMDFDRFSRKGTLILKLNGTEARYTDVLKDNDKIEIYWEGSGP